jgi:hypothetical protein
MYQHQNVIINKSQFNKVGGLGGGHSNIEVATYQGKTYALKKVGVEEFIKYELLKKIDINVPDSIYFVVENLQPGCYSSSGEYFTATEIMPGYAPLGALFCVDDYFFTNIDSHIYTFIGGNANSYCTQKYETWVRNNNLPLDQEAFSLYQKLLSSPNKVSVPIVGIENLFAASLFIDDQVPFGKVRIEKGWVSCGATAINHQEEAAKLFGNILVKPCKSAGGEQIYLRAVKIDTDAAFLPYASTSLMQEFFTNPSDIGKKQLYRGGEDISVLYKPFVPHFTTKQLRLQGAEKIAALKYADLEQALPASYTISPDGNNPPPLTPSRRNDLLAYLEQKIQFFRAYLSKP